MPWTLTFERTDDKPVHVQVCPNGENSQSTRLRLGGYAIDVVWASDAEIDCASSETDASRCRGFFDVKETDPASTNTLQNVRLTFSGLPGYKITDAGCTVALNGTWKGVGEIVKKGLGGIVFPGDFSGFAGTIREFSGPNLEDITGAAAGILMRAAGASNVTAHVYGWGSYNLTSGVPQHTGRNRGTLGTGGASVGPEKGVQGPAKGLYMHGGTYRVNYIENTNWGVGVADEKAFDVLSVGAGFNYVTLVDGKGNASGHPINAITVKALSQTDKGTVVIYDPSLNNNANRSVTNSMFTVLDWADHAVGGTGYGENNIAGATDDFAIIPWMVANGNDKFEWLQFPAVDANGRLVKPVRTNTNIDTGSSPNANVACSDGYGDLRHGTATDIVMNSLFINNSAKGAKYLGADRTLTVKSGGLLLQSGSAIGLSGRDDNGRLVLGDATHPAYVWNRAWGNVTNRIWATVSAPGGFVSTYTGNLELGGDQTGIAGEIVVNGGTLALGDAEHGITLTNGLPIRVCAGAKLILPSRNAIKKSPLKIDGSAEAFGKVELPVNQTCKSLAVRDVYESTEWDDLPEGTYGSSESAAEFVRDDIFTGPGVLRVGAAPTPSGLMFMIY